MQPSTVHVETRDLTLVIVAESETMASMVQWEAGWSAWDRWADSWAGRGGGGWESLGNTPEALAAGATGHTGVPLRNWP